MYRTGQLTPDPRAIETAWDYADDCPDFTGAWEDPYCLPLDVVEFTGADDRRAA